MKTQKCIDFFNHIQTTTGVDLKARSWSDVANLIQDAAYDTMSQEEFDAYSMVVEEDIFETSGTDGLLFNGFYFDWKEFWDTESIVSAYLGYFTDDQLELIKTRMTEILLSKNRK